VQQQWVGGVSTIAGSSLNGPGGTIWRMVPHFWRCRAKSPHVQQQHRKLAGVRGIHAECYLAGRRPAVRLRGLARDRRPVAFLLPRLVCRRPGHGHPSPRLRVVRHRGAKRLLFCILREVPLGEGQHASATFNRRAVVVDGGSVAFDRVHRSRHNSTARNSIGCARARGARGAGSWHATPLHRRLHRGHFVPAH